MKKYVGAIMPDMPCSRFIASVFYDETDKQYFVQEETADDLIGKFCPITDCRHLHRIGSALTVTEGDPFIYSYTVEGQLPFYGNRAVIGKHLLKLIDSNKLTIHARLLLSAFLHLDGKTIQLVDTANKDLQKRNSRQKIDDDVFFEDAHHAGETFISIMDQILQKLEECRQENKEIRITDIVFIKGDMVYFNRKFVKAKEIIKKKLLANSFFNVIISEVISFCSDRKLLNLSKILESPDAYEFMLESEAVVLNQKSIERTISKTVDHTKFSDRDSVLNKGIEVDKKLHNNTGKAGDLNEDNEKALFASVDRIIESAY